MRWNLLLLGLLLSGCAGRMHPSAASFRDRIAGCYEFREGPWRTDSLLNRPYRVANLAPRLQLRPSRLRGWDELQSDRCHSSRLPHSFRVGTALVGTITSFTDAIPRDGVAHVERPIVLDRIGCENK